jgi:hypothetical protein
MIDVCNISEMEQIKRNPIFIRATYFDDKWEFKIWFFI